VNTGHEPSLGAYLARADSNQPPLFLLPQKLTLAHRPSLLYLLPEFAMITLTESAVQELKSLLEKKGASGRSGLRLGVERGGCAGFQYAMQVSEKTEGDEVIEQDGARVFLAADSLEHLRGAQLDYSDDLTNSGFKVVNPNAARSCGCGTSFQTKKEGLEPGHDPALDSTSCC